MTSWAGHDNNLPSNRNISKTVRVNVTFTNRFEEIFNKLSSDNQTLNLRFFSYWCLKFMKSLKSRKLSFSFFPGLGKQLLIFQKKSLRAVLQEQVLRTFLKKVAHSIAECRQAYLKATLLHKWPLHIQFSRTEHRFFKTPLLLLAYQKRVVNIS